MSFGDALFSCVMGLFLQSYLNCWIYHYQTWSPLCGEIRKQHKWRKTGSRGESLCCCGGACDVGPKGKEVRSSNRGEVLKELVIKLISEFRMTNSILKDFSLVSWLQCLHSWTKKRCFSSKCCLSRLIFNSRGILNLVFCWHSFPFPGFHFRQKGAWALELWDHWVWIAEGDESEGAMQT